MLRSRGHDVIEYVVDNQHIAQGNLIRVGLDSIWNTAQYERVRKLIREVQPDLVKVDNYFPVLSPSIFAAAKSMEVPIVLSVRNYRPICPAVTLFRDGHVCKDCVGRSLALPAVWHRCYHNSYLQSSAATLSNLYAHLRGTWANHIDRYIAVSESVKRLLISGGFSPDKISVKPNSVADTGLGHGEGAYAIYVGRLTEEKGIRTLLDAWRKIGLEIPLKIIGGGPLEELVLNATKEYQAIEFLQRKTLSEVCEYVGRAMMLIFPSEWLEPFGRSIVEAYSKGTPVIAADTEPMRDMVHDLRTGVLFNTGDSEDLADKVRALAADPELRGRLRRGARAEYVGRYSEDSCYAQMMEIFCSVSSSQSPARG